MSTADEHPDPTEGADDRDPTTDAKSQTTEDQESDADRFNEIALRDGATPAVAEASSMPRDEDERSSGD